MNTNTLAQAANEARGLAMDAVHACNSGHLGLPLGCAEIGAVLFGEAMRYFPDAPKWLNRDRFILSAGVPRRREKIPRAALDHAGASRVP
jgi:transketolase